MGMDAPPPTAPPPAATPMATKDPIADVVAGQKMILYAILLSIVTGVLRFSVHEIFALLQLAAAVVAIIGLVRLAGGMGWSTGVKVVLVILALIPLISLITLAIVNGRATERLKANGYRVGLMGARKT